MSFHTRHVPWILASLLIVGLTDRPVVVQAQPVIPSQLTLADPLIDDQDDMCIWIHPTNRSLSTIITSDKAAAKLFVYDLQGNTVQVIPIAGQPGNIDVRYGFELAGTDVDIVALNDRNHSRLEVYRVNPQTRQLARVDNGAISTISNYGMCLYRSRTTGLYHAFVTSENGALQQLELRDENGQVAARQVRGWSLGSITEGCVCDDEAGKVYFGEENVGIWKAGAEPGDPTTTSLIASVGDPSGLNDDVEGLSIYYAAQGDGYLVASSQGSNEFKVYERSSPHAYVSTFKVAGVTSTDGIDLTNVSLGPAFPAGLIAVHNAAPANKPVEVARYEATGLAVDTLFWNPRWTGTTSTELPPSGPHGLALHGGRPNPAKRSLTLSFTLPDARPARLEVFDPAGRRIWSRRVDELGRGTHQVPLQGEVALRAGTYLIRLTQGSHSLTRTTVLVP